MSGGYHNRTELNNVAQRRGHSVQYADTRSGPQHNEIWDSIVYLNQYEYGRGRSTTKGGAREVAAGQALIAIAQGY
ncbi:hypothetical protein GGX14DRAFT_460674 [Mycena pura]|uniref:DRBM domain-containing protein n=1 Tax=Mycena pura TaxID=153505 RepID=A0AAD6V7C8_9AGAR|nr:hypothetical protein GGX14DRAFT_460674 [Mycena pura]